jgi:hypothetical protein
MTALPHNPGSAAALALGCCCPILDNAHGRGYMCQPGIFVYTIGCPYHDAGRSYLRDAKEESP